MDERVERLLRLGIVAFWVALVVYGISVHVVPADDTAEADGYLVAAQRIREGVWPAQKFQPLLFPTVVAGVAVLFDDVMFAARLVSTTAAAFVLFATYRLGALVASPAIGLAAASLVCVSATFVVHGVLASSDMMFLALQIFVLVGVVRFIRRHRLRTAFAIGLMLGLAWSTRYVAMVSLVPIVVAMWLAPRRVLSLGSVATGACLTAAPQFYVNYREFGNGLYNELWRNLYLKLDGRHDWGLLAAPLEVEGWLDVVRSDPGGVVDGLGSELAVAATDTVPRLLGGGVPGFGVAVVLALALLIRVLPIRKRPRFARSPMVDPLWAWAIAYVGSVALTFYCTTRLLLPVLPIVAILVSRLVFGSMWTAVFARSTLSIVLATLLHVTLLVGLAMDGLPHLVQFERDHSPDVWKALRWVERRGVEDGIVLGDHPTMRSYFEFYVLEAAGARMHVPEEQYFEALAAYCRASDVRYLVFSEKWLGTRPRALLAGASCPLACVEFVHRAGTAVVYRRRPQ